MQKIDIRETESPIQFGLMETIKLKKLKGAFVIGEQYKAESHRELEKACISTAKAKLPSSQASFQSKLRKTTSFQTQDAF